MYLDHSAELIPIMSAWARLCQRPPRSRASASRTSSQSCSESTSTPSKSKTTASTCVPMWNKASDGQVAVFAIDEPRPRLAFLERHDLADEERMVARVVLRPDAAFDPRERIGQERSAGNAVPNGDAVPEHDRRRTACEPRRDVGLIATQDRHAERAGGPQQLVQG